MKLPIEKLADLYVAQQLGHADPRTTQQYRMKHTREKRKTFRNKIK